MSKGTHVGCTPCTTYVVRYNISSGAWNAPYQQRADMQGAAQ